MKIGPAITKLRGIKMLSQEQLAEKSGLALFDIMALEDGTMEPTKDLIKKVCVGLDVSREVLVFEALEESDIPDEDNRRAIFDQLKEPLSDWIKEGIRPTGIDLITRERSEHFTKHGRTVEQDVELNGDGQLASAAILLADTTTTYDFIPKGWDETIWIRMIQKPYKERLIIAGSLLAAEYDRLQAIEE